MFGNLPKELQAVRQLSGGYENEQLRRDFEEQVVRECEALRLYEPMPHQERMHASKVRTVVMRKGNQVGGEQPYDSCIITPQGKTTIGALDVGDVILGGDGLPCVVEGVQEYGDSPVYRFTFSDGTTCEAGENHKWTLRMGGRTRRPANASVNSRGWRVHTTKELLRFIDKYGYRFGNGRGSGHYRVCFPTTTAQFDSREVPIDPYTLGVLIGDGNFTHRAISVTSEDAELVGALSVPDGCKISKLSNKSTTVERYGAASLYGISGTKWHSNPLSDGLKLLGLHGKCGHEKFIPKCYIYNSVDVRLGLLQGLMDTDGNCGHTGCATFYTTSERLASDVTDLVQSLGGCASTDWRANSHDGKPGKPLAHISISLPPELNPFHLSRKRDRRIATMKHKYRWFRYLQKVEYVGVKACRCIKVGNASLTYLTDNYIVTHNTLSFAVEVARAVTAQDPYHKYPKRDGVACILGYGEGHIGNVFYPKLFKAGAFDIIKDKVTGKWRTFRPWPESAGGDLEREEEKKPAPPLIPRRFLAEEPAWVSKKDRIFSKVQFTNGWELRAYNSAGDPGQAQGFIADLYGIDEDTSRPGWVEEILFRLVKKRGLLRWTAKPHGKNDEMMKLLDKAEEQRQSPNPNVVLISATLYDNKYIEETSKTETIETAMAMGEDVYRERVLGELNLDSVLMYPTFDRRLHDVMNGAPLRSKAQQILAERMGEPPDDWCCYVSIDPGSQVCAMEFLCCPPPDLGNQIFVYDECYIKGSNTILFGEAMQRKCSDRVFQAFLFDFHGGKLRGTAGGDVPIDLYRDALQERAIKSQTTGSSFRPGCDDIKLREEEMRVNLAISREGWPRLMVVAGKCPMFVSEMEKFRKKTVQHGGKAVPIDEGNRKGFTHAIECVEMAIGSGIDYVRPVKKSISSSFLDNALTWADRQRERSERPQRILRGGDFISLGPNGAR